MLILNIFFSSQTLIPIKIPPFLSHAVFCFFIHYTLYCWKEKLSLFLFIVIMLPGKKRFRQTGTYILKF
ncbi:hypothetical protein BEI59_31915 [Eisenbergiella tayi]|uniref:Uncharacterized protein n=1 Tax=Eisenbergiella tayi TaxID=1432052 RepID=A0A1E3U7G2_9FIRM|nr:hypothetical protein BEI62_27735 [Eisenbergiella tayi]ODR38744.1 hypothetical protein BEI60_07320 [Eisenbergiella tayi]ODR42152.1 hypothetical protein BEI59_31915 [Eisenbergiella tayi]ODR53250.1 hypothetical protein BEI63_18990 [Eisenbergiella tayi]